MKTRKLLAAISAVALSAGAGQASAQEMQPGIFMVAQGASQKIDRHGVCRVVRNDGSNPLMVPTGSPQQWHSGNGSFLNNFSNMPHISVSGCDGRQDDRCFFWVSPIGSANVTEPPSEWVYNKLKIGDVSMTYTIDRWNDWEDEYETIIAGGSIVSSGDYPDSYGTIAEPGPFHRADNGTFDSLAVGPDTTVTIYPQKNHSGTPLVVTGPKVLVNHALTSRGYWGDQWLTENWGTSDTILRWFPPATRELTAPGVTLRNFGRGSVKVECS